MIKKISMPKSKIRLVSQVTFKINPANNDDLFTSTVLNIIEWINKKAGGKLPEIAWECKSFELSEIGAQRTAAELLSDPKYWAARIDDADKTVAQRTWLQRLV